MEHYVNLFSAGANAPILLLVSFLGGVIASVSPCSLAGTPCSTPILAAIMSFAALSNKIVLALMMLFLFAIGQGLIILLVGVGLSKVKSMNKIAKFSDYLLKFSGLILVFASVYIFYKIFSPYIVN